MLGITGNRRGNWLQLLFDLDQAPRRNLPRCEPARVSGYRSQLRFLRCQFSNAILYVQRGRGVDQFAAAAKPIDPPSGSMRARVTSVIVRKAGYLHGGLKRRLVTHINFCIG